MTNSKNREKEAISNFKEASTNKKKTKLQAKKEILLQKRNAFYSKKKINGERDITKLSPPFRLNKV